MILKSIKKIDLIFSFSPVIFPISIPLPHIVFFHAHLLFYTPFHLSPFHCIYSSSPAISPPSPVSFSSPTFLVLLPHYLLPISSLCFSVHLNFHYFSLTLHSPFTIPFNFNFSTLTLTTLTKLQSPFFPFYPLPSHLLFSLSTPSSLFFYPFQLQNFLSLTLSATGLHHIHQ